MEKEDYVSCNVAKMLQGKGYKEKCSSFWSIDPNGKGSPILNMTLGLFGKDDMMHKEDWSEQYDYLAPSLYETQQWLISRGLFVQIGYVEHDEGGYDYKIEIIKERDMVGNGCLMYETYQEALNEGIKEALKYI